MLSWVTRTHISLERANFLWDMGEVLGLGKTYQSILSGDCRIVKNLWMFRGRTKGKEMEGS